MRKYNVYWRGDPLDLWKVVEATTPKDAFETFLKEEQTIKNRLVTVAWGFDGYKQFKVSDTGKEENHHGTESNSAVEPKAAELEAVTESHNCDLVLNETKTPTLPEPKQRPSPRVGAEQASSKAKQEDAEANEPEQQPSRRLEKRLIILSSIFWTVFGVWLCAVKGVPRVLDADERIHSTIEAKNRLTEYEGLKEREAELEAKADQYLDQFDMFERIPLFGKTPFQPEIDSVRKDMFHIEHDARSANVFWGILCSVGGVFSIGALFLTNKLIKKCLDPQDPADRTYFGITEPMVSKIIDPNERVLVACKYNQSHATLGRVPISVGKQYLVFTETRLLHATKTTWKGVETTPIPYSIVQTIILRGRKWPRWPRIIIRFKDGEMIDLIVGCFVGSLYKAIDKKVDKYAAVARE